MNDSSVMYAMPRRLLRWPVAISLPVCALLLLFLLSLPLVNPYVHGDGVGSYAYAQSLVIDHDLNFEDDWRAANPRVSAGSCGCKRTPLPEEYHGDGPVPKSLFYRAHNSVGPVSRARARRRYRCGQPGRADSC